MEIATTFTKNRSDSVIGVKARLLRDMGADLETQWYYTTNVSHGAKAEEAFLEFISRRGRPLTSWSD